MIKLSYHLLIFLLIISCSREYTVLETMDPAKVDYKLYIIPNDESGADSASYEGQTTIDKPILIDDQNTLQAIKREWILSESAAPKEKNVRYKLILYQNKEPIWTAWLDEKYEILIWEDQLLAFVDSLLFKHKDSFKYLPEFEVGINDVETARVFKSSVVDAGGIITHDSKNRHYWEKYDGKYNLRRLRNDLKPDRNIGKLRQKIKDDFPTKEFFLLGFEFDADSDSMTVSIASDSTFREFIPESYNVIGSFAKFGNIKFSCIGLNKSEIERIAEENDISLLSLYAHQ